MIKYIVYGNYQVVCEVQDGYYKKQFLVRDYDEQINSFIKDGYAVTFDGNNLTLEGEGITFEFKNITLDALEKNYKDESLLILLKDVKEKMGIQSKIWAMTSKIKDFFHGFKRKIGYNVCVGTSVALIAYILIAGNILDDAFDSQVKDKDDYNEKPFSSYDVGAEVSEPYAVMEKALIKNSARPGNLEDKKQEELKEIEANSESEKVEPTYEEICDEYVIKYAKIFHLDQDKLLEFLHRATDNYTKDFSEVSGSSYYDVDNLEAAIMVLVYNTQRDMLGMHLADYAIPITSAYYDTKKFPADNVYTSDFFKTGEEIVHISEDLKLENGLTYSEYMGVISDLLGADKNYLLAIAFLETGRFKSPLVCNKNNFGGLRGRGTGFYTYPTPEAGIIAFCYNLRAYAKYDFTSLEALSCRYVNGNFEVPDLKWANNIENIHDEITSNPDAYFLTEDEVTTYSQNNNLKKALSNY